MTEDIAARYLLFLFALAGIGVVLCGLRAYNRDAFRQRAFALRDELFDYAAAGHVSFDDPAYWRLRLAMNATIRFSHRLTFCETLLPILVSLSRRRLNPPASYSAWRDAVESQPREVRDKLDRFNSLFGMLFGRQLILHSPVLWPFLALLLILDSASDLRKKFTEQAAFAEEDSESLLSAAA